MIIAPKLQKGDTVRVIAPARSISMPFIQNVKDQAIKKFQEVGLQLTFGKHVEQIDDFNSSSIESRIDDLHEAFRDRKVKLVITVIGGFNSNQLLKYIDFDLIKDNPKILCGYSDITALANAIYAKTGLVTYSGPHFFNFGDLKSFDYSWEYFQKCLFYDNPFEVKPSLEWSDDLWAIDQEKRALIENGGYWDINHGITEGVIIGANLGTLNLLQGTEYMPNLENTIVFLEQTAEHSVYFFDRDLQSLIHQPGFDKVKGIVIGRFQKKTEMTRELLSQIIKSKKELNSIPVIANVDFGHTTPMITFPIGGTIQVETSKEVSKIKIIKH